MITKLREHLRALVETRPEVRRLAARMRAALAAGEEALTPLGERLLARWRQYGEPAIDRMADAADRAAAGLTSRAQRLTRRPREAGRTRRVGRRRASGGMTPLSPLARIGGASGRSFASGLAALSTTSLYRVRALSLGMGRQLEAARDVQRRTSHVLRDGQGRRLRASAYGRHPGSSRRGGDLAGAGGLLPAGVKVGLVLLLTLGGFLGSSQLFIDYAAYLPDAHALTSNPLPEDTMIYAGDGSLIADLREPGTGLQHYYQPLDQMGKLLPEATVAIEDSNFWNEPGIDPQGIARAAWTDWRAHRTAQGASTITQQLVKLRLLQDKSQTLDRKVKEAILAIQVDHTYSKRQILEMYLNSVDYGNHAKGAEAAALNYFRKAPSDLDLAQASMLAGIPQSPPNNSPLYNPDGAKERQKQVLNAMVRNKLITREQADQAYAEKLQYFGPDDSIKAAPAFVSWVVGQLQQMYGPKTAYGGGLRVYTTIDLALQKIAESSVQNNVMNARNQGHNMQQGAMVSMDPRTGAIKTMVGSAFHDQYGGWYNWAADVPLNPGSTAKLFTYTAAIESLKYTMVTPVPDRPMSVSMPGQQPGWQPKNYNTSSYIDCVLQTCMGNSLNIPAVYAEITTGVDKVVEMGRRLGAPPWFADPNTGKQTQDAPLSVFGAPFTLGSYGETPLQMATAAATIADMGVYHPATGIARITASDGTELYRYDAGSVGKQVLDPRVAYIMQTIMSNNNNRIMVFGGLSANLTLPGRRVGAKTGTSDSWKDDWTLGYTPSLASAFWFGNPDNSSLGDNFDAVLGAAPGWHDFMLRALDAMHAPNNEWFSPPPGLVQGPGDQVWLMPGTSAGQPTPPLPRWASMAGPPKNNPPNLPPPSVPGTASPQASTQPNG